MSSHASQRGDAAAPAAARQQWLACPAGLPQRYWTLVTSFLPDALDTALLRAALASGDDAQRAWDEWSSAVGDPVRTLGTDKRYTKILVPQLWHNLRRNGASVSPAFATYAKAAHLTETLRMTGHARESARALKLMADAGVTTIVLKGAALAHTVYAEPALRHAHDFDVLVPEAQLARAAEALIASGFTAERRLSEGLHHLSPLRNPVGFEVELHRSLSFLYKDFDGEDLFARSVPITIAGQPTRSLSLVDSLVHTGVHAVGCTSSANLRWVCDAERIVGRMQPADWTSFARIVDQRNVALPMLVTLGFLADVLDVPVPVETLSRLKAAAALTDRAGRSAAAFCARRFLPGDLRGILELDGGWRPRLEQIGWRLAPPPRHVRWTYGVTRSWMVPLYYPYRALMLVAELAGRPMEDRLAPREQITAEAAARSRSARPTGAL